MRTSIVIIALAATLTATAAEAQCTKDTDCKGDRICMKGSCLAPNAAPTPVPASPGAPAAAPSTTGQSAQPAAAAKAPLKRAEIITLYEKGSAETARDEAERAGERDLVAKLAAFVKSAKDAAAAVAADDRTLAIQHYEAALAVDGQVSPGGKSAYAAAINKKLAAQWVAVAAIERRSGNIDGARTALNIALKYDPNESEAAAQLASLNDAAPSRAPRTPVAGDTPRMPAGATATDAADCGGEVRKAKLMQEREDLLARRPGLTWPVTALVIGLGTAIAAGIGLASAGGDDGATKLWLFVLGFDVGFVIIDIINLVGAVMARSAIDDRVSEIEGQFRGAF